MTILANAQPFPLFFDKVGAPLSGGSVYFGQPNQNPETAPVTVYWDVAGTQPAPQPLKTVSGYIVRNGTPALVYINGDYSITVKAKNGTLLFYVPSAAALDNSQVIANQIAAFSLPSGSSLIGFIQGGTGAVGRTVESKGRDVINAFDFMTPAQVSDCVSGASTLDVTTAIQNAINYASNNGFQEVVLDAGKFQFSKLYFYYDAGLNPGYNPSLQGRIRLVGAGQLNHAEANTWPGSWSGTVLVSNIASGDAINISPASSDGGAYPSRQTVLENITVVANTPGFCIRHYCAISSQMRNVTVLQLNASGNGVYWHSGWFTLWENVWVTNRQTTLQTGVGVDFGATLFAGSFRFSNCCFERFRDGFQINDSVQSVCMLFDGVGTFQSNARDGLQINASVRSLVVDSGYFEFNGRSHVRCTLSSGGVQSLAIRGGFALGGTSSATSMTGPMFYLRNVTNWSIDGLAVFRPWTDVVDVGWYSANGSVGAIKNVCVDASDNTPGSVIYLVRVDDQRAMPTFEGNNLIGSAQVKEYDSSTYFLNSKHALLGFAAMAWNSPVQRKTLGLNGTDFMQSATTAPVVIYNVTGIGSFAALPGSPGDGRHIVVANQVTSGTSTLIRQPDAVTNLATLNAGQAIICYFEPTAAKWVAIGPVAFAGV